MTKKIFGETDGIRAKVGDFPLRPNVLKTLGSAIAGEMQAKEFLIATLQVSRTQNMLCCAMVVMIVTITGRR